MNSILTLQRHHVIAIVLAVVTFAAYSQVLNNGFTNYDDADYVTANTHVQSGITLDGIIWAFTTGDAANWHPITWISHMLDCQLFGLNAWGHHLISLLFHITNTVLLFFVLTRMTNTVWQSAFVAALFALHPLHVESVAWAAERKDVLSTLFWLLTMIAYVRYVDRPGIKTYPLVLLFLALGLMSKPMLVTLPFVLLLLDYWPLGRFPGWIARDVAKRQGGVTMASPYGRSVLLRLVWEKIPMFALVALSSYITFRVQKSAGAVAITDLFSVSQRIANAINSYVAYIVNMIWPTGLAVFYPYPESALPPWKVAVGVTVLISIFVMMFRALRRRPYFATGWLWYVGTLVPVIGIVQVGEQAMADRYTYIPLLGIFIIIAWGLPEVLAKWKHRTIGLSIAAAVCLSALASRTWSQVSYWKDTVTLLEHALDVTTNNWTAHNNLGSALAGEKRFDEARAHYEEVFRLKPTYAAPHYNLGVASSEEGKKDEAILHYTEAIRLDANYADAHHNLALLFAEKGKSEKASEHYRRAIQINPNHEKARFALANLLAAEGEASEAIAQYRNVIRINPGLPDAHISLGVILLKEGKISEAIAEYFEALRLNPNLSDARNNLGVALSQQGKVSEAIEQYTEALRLFPDHAGAHNNLGLLLARQGNVSEARIHFSEALRVNPNYAEAQNNLEGLPAGEGKITDAKVHYNMGIALDGQGKVQDAVAEYNQALKLKPDYAEVHNNLGVALGKLGKMDEAMAHLSEALRLDPNYADAHNNLGIAFAMQGKPSEAIIHFSAVVRLNPNQVSARYNLGLLLARQGKVDEAMKEFQAALRIKPDYAEARNELEKLRRLRK